MSKIIVGVDPAGKDSMGFAMMRQLSDGKIMVIDDVYPTPESFKKAGEIIEGSAYDIEERIQRYMAGYDISLNRSERELVQLKAYDEFREGIGNYRIPPPIPTRTYDEFRPLYGQKRAKALAKRAKAKAHRKASRK